MYNLSAFISIPALTNNQAGQDSPLGELSATAKTYSREVGIYKTQDHLNTVLNAFYSATDGVITVVDPMITAALLDVAEFLYNRAIDGTLSDDKSSCQQLLLTQFGGTVQFNLVGRMVTNGVYWMPETLTLSLVGFGENEIRIWFSDPAFRSQYDRYEIVVVPPVESLDDLHGHRAVVLTLLDSLTISEHVTKVNRLIAEDPQTYLISHEYDWTDKNDPTVKKATPWTVIVYGVGGNNDDVIREALVDYILANSNYPRSEWEKIYPDLFLPLEFYVTPMWDRYSLPNMQTSAGIYSPTVSWVDVMRYALGTCYNQTFQHASEHVATTQTLYKSLGLVVLGNSRNRNGIFDFGTLWPEYATLPSTNADFARMSLLTQRFSLMLTQSLIHAESLTPSSLIPEGYSRVKRGEYYYLAKTFNKVLYLFWLKFNDFPEIELPELPNYNQYRLTLTVSGEAGNQVITGVVSQDGTPGPINGAIPIDWYVTGDWFNTELQDADSTQSIAALVTNSETGSGIHQVRVEFLGSTGPVALTQQVVLLPAPAITEEFSLHLEYLPGNALKAEIRNLGVAVQQEDPEIFDTGYVTFTALARPTSTDEGYTVETLYPAFVVAIDNDPLLDAGVPVTRTVTASFAHADGRTITVQGTIQTPETPVPNDPTVDWDFDNFVDTNEVEHTLWAGNRDGGNYTRITDPNIVSWNLWLSDGRWLETDQDEINQLPQRVFRHTAATRMLLVVGVNDNGTVKYHSVDYFWDDFTAWQS